MTIVPVPITEARNQALPGGPCRTCENVYITDIVYKADDRMGRQGFLGEFELMVLLAVLRLEDNAYAPDIGAMLEARAGRRVSRGALYSSLDRLEVKGLLEWRIEATTARRGGHPKRQFRVTKLGIRALRTSRNALVNLWTGLDRFLGEPTP